jgi:hypothetical protein
MRAARSSLLSERWPTDEFSQHLPDATTRLRVRARVLRRIGPDGAIRELVAAASSNPPLPLRISNVRDCSRTDVPDWSNTCALLALGHLLRRIDPAPEPHDRRPAKINRSIHRVPNDANLSSRNDERSRSLRPVVISWAIASPTAAECLKPWPEQAETIVTFGISGA